jgi:phosphohistidine phosphatase
VKRLLLLRHAKAEPAEPGIHDHERALMARGRTDAPKLGRYIADKGFTPDVILTSTAYRTVETADLTAAEFSGTPQVDYLETLYLAAPEAILSIVRSAADATHCLMIVGHNPGLEQVATALAREPLRRKERDRFDRIEEKFPTAALAVLDFEVDRWRDIAPGQGALKDFVRPRDL